MYGRPGIGLNFDFAASAEYGGVLMAAITINQNKCKGCGLCTTVCPKKLLELDNELLNAKGYHPAKIKDMSLCIGCAMCATMCPDVAITVER